MRIFLAGTSLVALTACGGGDGIGVTNYDRLIALAEKAGDLELTAVMPVAGTAAYAGYYGIGSVEADDGYVGEAALSVDFTAGAIGGTIANFEHVVTDDDGTLIAVSDRDGALIVSGFVDGASPADFNATITGTLEIMPGDMTAIGGDALIAFAGPGADMLVGVHQPTLDGFADPDWVGLLIAD